MPAGRVIIIALLPLFFLGSCGDFFENLLDQGTGTPKKSSITGEVEQPPVSIPSGPYLYCITNIGATLVPFSLTERRVLTEARRVLFSDPVGPWFVGARGYYISRVAGDGSGKNALIEFDPVTLNERRRLRFPPNSNPTTLLVLPDGNTVYVALRGSTFDNFATNGLSVVDLPSLEQVGYLDLNNLGIYPDGIAEIVTSVVGLTWDAGCMGGACAYAVANNFDGLIRNGWLLLLRPDGDGLQLSKIIALGRNPQGEPMLEADGDLWVVNNGGFASFSGLPGTLQVLTSGNFADGNAANDTWGVLAIGGDPTGIFPFSATTGWVTTFPDDAVRTVDLAANGLNPGFAPVTATGPLFSTVSPSAALFAGLGGFGAARLGKLNTTTGTLEADYPLSSGNGTIGCAEYTVP